MKLNSNLESENWRIGELPKFERWTVWPCNLNWSLVKDLSQYLRVYSRARPSIDSITWWIDQVWIDGFGSGFAVKWCVNCVRKERKLFLLSFFSVFGVSIMTEWERKGYREKWNLDCGESALARARQLGVDLCASMLCFLSSFFFI